MVRANALEEAAALEARTRALSGPGDGERDVLPVEFVEDGLQRTCARVVDVGHADRVEHNQVR